MGSGIGKYEICQEDIFDVNRGTEVDRNVRSLEMHLEYL